MTHTTTPPPLPPPLPRWEPCRCGLVHVRTVQCTCLRYAEAPALPRAPLVALVLSALLGLLGGAVGAVWLAYSWGGR